MFQENPVVFIPQQQRGMNHTFAYQQSQIRGGATRVVMRSRQYGATDKKTPRSNNRTRKCRYLVL